MSRDKLVKKLDELESLIAVPDANKEPEQSINAIKMLKVIAELRGLVKSNKIELKPSGFGIVVDKSNATKTYPSEKIVMEKLL